MLDKHANLKYRFGNRHFQAERYYISTVGLNESTIKKYIQDQEKADIALDKLSVKEYADPFSQTPLGGGKVTKTLRLEQKESPRRETWVGIRGFIALVQTTRFTSGYNSVALILSNPILKNA